MSSGRPLLIKPTFDEDDDPDGRKGGDKTEINYKDGDDDGGDADEDVRWIAGGDDKLPTWTKDLNELRRIYVFDKLADSQIDGKILVENMDVVCRWLQTGEAPQPIINKRK